MTSDKHNCCSPCHPPRGYHRWESTGQVKNKDTVDARRRASGAAGIASKRKTFEATFFGDQQRQISGLQHVLRLYEDVTQSARDCLAITIEVGKRCEHCGAKLGTKGSRGVFCGNRQVCSFSVALAPASSMKLTLLRTVGPLIPKTFSHV